MTKNKDTADNTPDLIAYTVQSRGDNKSAIWTRLGAGWKHKDGKGYDVVCQAMPLDGRLTFRFQEKSTDTKAQDESSTHPTPDVR